LEVNSFAVYQRLAQRTANAKMDPLMRLAVAGLGIAGEAGEVADMIKKHVGHGHPLDKEKLSKELGDALWYVQEISEVLDIPLEDIAAGNILKLMKRYPEGFSEERSINRVE
jgi:NTP pyrophosphatase (non-canonical NTP hydrolase)